MRTGPAKAGSVEESLASGNGGSSGAARFGTRGEMSGTPPFRTWNRLTNGNVATRPAEAAIRAFGVLECSATKPHSTEPSASPPWKVIRYVPSARACTHAGTDTWTDVFSEAIVLVQQNPATISVAITTAGRCTSASTSNVAAL